MSETVKVGAVWIDKDKRMLSGNRRVQIVKVDAISADSGDVFYRGVFPNGEQHGPQFRSRISRFVKAFRAPEET